MKGGGWNKDEKSFYFKASFFFFSLNASSEIFKLEKYGFCVGKIIIMKHKSSCKRESGDVGRELGFEYLLETKICQAWKDVASAAFPSWVCDYVVLLVTAQKSKLLVG